MKLNVLASPPCLFSLRLKMSVRSTRNESHKESVFAIKSASPLSPQNTTRPFRTVKMNAHLKYPFLGLVMALIIWATALGSLAIVVCVPKCQDDTHIRLCDGTVHSCAKCVEHMAWADSCK